MEHVNTQRVRCFFSAHYVYIYRHTPRVESTASTNSGLAPRRLDFLKKLSRIQRRCTYVITDNSLRLARNIRDAGITTNLCKFCRIISKIDNTYIFLLIIDILIDKARIFDKNNVLEEIFILKGEIKNYV